MFIEFSVTNFLSFYQKQTLSMVATSAKELDANTFLPVGKAKLPPLLHSAGVYGANASGKSNLLLAMKRMREIILSSAKESQAGELIKGIHPHALEKEQPTEFEVIFLVDGVRYEYGFATTRQRIVEEWLFAFPSGRTQRWFSRVYDVETKDYDWKINSTYVKGRKEIWKESTRENALFLSTAAQLNSEQFGKVVEWFRKNLKVKGANTNSSSPKETLELLENQLGKEQILKFLNTADITINDISVVEKPLTMDMLPAELPLEIKQEILQEFADVTKLPTIQEIEFSHRTADGKNFRLTLSLESDGTRSLFKSAGMWLNVLSEGCMICVDELESSLHPLIARFLVELFHNPETNPNHAQLIFTTHDTTLLDSELLRRDQIWFVEKDSQQSTQLYPLSDFSPRKQEALQKGYLQGRYGALPYVSSPQWLK